MFVFMSVPNIYIFAFIICPKFIVMHIDKKKKETRLYNHIKSYKSYKGFTLNYYHAHANKDWVKSSSARSSNGFL